MKNHTLHIATVIIAVSTIMGWFCANAQENQQSANAVMPFYELSIEELLKIEISTVSKINEGIREAPGVMSIVTREDIRLNNCRDMVDVFNMIPGFTILTDLVEIQSLGTRGLYGFEGRTLIMVDGMQLNENLFGTYPLGNDFPLNIIERIEIIRGPGSVTYGGAAELAVINIITQKGSSEKLGVDVHANYGVTAREKVQTGHRDLTLRASQATSKLNYAIFGHIGESAKGTSSDRLDYLSQDPNFPGYEINHTNTGNTNISLGGSIAFKEKYKVNSFYKRYQNYTPIADDSIGDVWGTLWTRGELFETFNTVVTTEHNVAGFTLKPGLGTQYSLAWYMNQPSYRALKSEAISIWRKKAFLNAERGLDNILSANDKLIILIGGEYFYDNAFSTFQKDETGAPYNPLKKPADTEWSNNIGIWNYGLYGSVKYSIANIHCNAGLRYDHNELTNDKLSPRLGVTYVKNKFHTKLLYSNAFRAPNIANIATDYSIANVEGLGIDIRRESTSIYELELGYQCSKSFFVTINAYSQVVEDIIEFNPDYNYLSVNATRKDGNTAKHGSEGLESEFKFRNSKYEGVLNTTFIRPGNGFLFGQNNVDGTTYMAPLEGQHRFNGVPMHKIYTNHSFSFFNDLAISIGLLYYSQRYEYRYDQSFTPYARSIEGQLITNFGLHCNNLLVKGLKGSFSVHDLFGQELTYVSAFDSYWIYDSTPFSSINARGPEFTFSLHYSLQ